MLTQTEIERERYESRRKAQLDHNSLLYEAREEGLERGEKIGRIHLSESLLNRPQTPTEHLIALPPEALARLAQELELLLKQR